MGKKPKKVIEQIRKLLDELELWLEEAQSTEIKITDTATVYLMGYEITAKKVENSGLFGFFELRKSTGIGMINKTYGWELMVFIDGKHKRSVRTEEKDVAEILRKAPEDKVYFGGWWFAVEDEKLAKMYLI